MTYYNEDRDANIESTKTTSFEDENVFFFGGDISYEIPEKYDDGPDKRRDIRSVFSLTHFALAVYLLTSQGAASIILVLSSLFLTIGGSINEISTNTDFLLGLNAICQYTIAFPLFFLLTKGIKKNTNSTQNRISVGKFLAFFVVAEGVMLFGGILANLISRLFDAIFGIGTENVVDSMLGYSNPWVIVVCVCILAPVFEEAIFRKILIDRFSRFGDGPAIFFSAIAFGLFHGNISQFIYATAVGIILGYMYTLTRRIEYTVILHAFLNFFGSIIPMGIEWIQGESERLHGLAKEGAVINTTLASFYDILLIAYTVLTFAFIVAAFILIVWAAAKKKIRVEKCENFDIMTVVKTGISNAGCIIFLILSFAFILISLLSF